MQRRKRSFEAEGEGCQESRRIDRIHGVVGSKIDTRMETTKDRSPMASYGDNTGLPERPTAFRRG